MKNKDWKYQYKFICQECKRLVKWIDAVFINQKWYHRNCVGERRKIKMRLPKLTTRKYNNTLDNRIFTYHRLVGWYNFQLSLRGRLFSLIIPARRTK